MQSFRALVFGHSHVRNLASFISEEARVDDRISSILTIRGVKCYLHCMGVGGYRTQDVRNDLPWMQSHGADVLVLMIGDNDVHHGATGAQIATKLLSLITDIHDQMPTTRLVLTSLLPRFEPTDDFVDRMRARRRYRPPRMNLDELIQHDRD
ncbi:hypothetical protein BaRGS_00006523 [Batillaria attramentaria]|uniref:SGNH hydrolase-type esterase domain-containing protein n=1 Tax=Batillaria attramentaria TaxID=370345 RepID=A0ABD0LR42_9CAEN